MIHIFLVFLRLGLSSFGGPVAHLGFFHSEFVERRRWMSEQDYADLVALCQFLPGPASSQVGLAVGYYRHSYAGALAAWLGFTLPSALLMILFAVGVRQFDMSAGMLLGLKLVAIAVVVHAIWGMAKSFCREYKTVVLAVASAATLLVFPNYLAQLCVIIGGAVCGRILFSSAVSSTNTAQSIDTSQSSSAAKLLLLAFLVLLVGLPVIAGQTDNDSIKLFDIFYRVGSLVFGGGHVVLPMLQAELVPSGIIATDQFLVGYGAAQAVPGPLFTFAGFLGATTPLMSSQWLGGLLCLVAIFLPSFLLVLGCLPYWDVLRHNASIQSSLVGINATVVGILTAAFINPVLASTVSSIYHVVIVVIAFIALQKYKVSPWLLVVLGALLGAILTNLI